MVASSSVPSTDPYEDPVVLDQYLLFHYGTADQIRAGSDVGAMIPDGALAFPVATAAFADFALLPEGPRALDVGCAVGRSTFELSRTCDEVVGVDYSQTFIDAASRLRAGEALGCRRFTEGHLWDDLTVDPPGDVPVERVHFEQGDAMNLRPHLGDFDLVHAANLLCRLPDPEAFLRRLPTLVRPGGLLVLATPATWMEHYTPIDAQPEGATLDFLGRHLGGEFERLQVAELPFAIREHARKFQISTAQTSLWRRR